MYKYKKMMGRYFARCDAIKNAVITSLSWANVSFAWYIMIF
jgi:hypothetical protein